MTVEFTIPGPPVGKGRPRFRRVGKFVQTYTPKKTKDYENLVRKEYKKQAKGKKLSGAIKADICAVFPIPKSTNKKRRQEMIDGGISHTSKIDLDNICKSVFDALNDTAYTDDAAIDEIHAAKMYGETPRCEVRLTDDKHIICPIFFNVKTGGAL